VKQTSRQLIAGFLLLFLVATLFPFNLFHHHHDGAHCHDGDSLAMESSSFENESHLDNAEIECELCKLFSSQRHFYTITENAVASIVFYQDQPVVERSSATVRPIFALPGRAPPLA
jgi:hypothetical protein